MRTVGDWIYDENLAVFLDTLGYIVGTGSTPSRLR